MQSHWLLAVVLISASLALFSPVRAVGDVERSTADEGGIQIDPDSIPRWRVGQLFITGNDTVPDRIILEQCPLFSGQLASTTDLREAEKNLARLGLFVVDRKRGIKPTVKALDREGDGCFRDIQIEVKEKANAKLILSLRESIWFVADCGTWGVCAAVYRAEGFPRDILNLVTEENIAEIIGPIHGKSSVEEKEG
ncbi:MAG TPA: hypothetical protein VMG10_16675 [Gemmataceae bacterium]|nr:hypothetical protein [Gemmataceae bacterium]